MHFGVIKGGAKAWIPEAKTRFSERNSTRGLGAHLVLRQNQNHVVFGTPERKDLYVMDFYLVEMLTLLTGTG